MPSTSSWPCSSRAVGKKAFERFFGCLLAVVNHGVEVARGQSGDLVAVSRSWPALITGRAPIHVWRHP